MSLPVLAEDFTELVDEAELFGAPELSIADIEAGYCFELTPEQMREVSETGELTVMDDWLFE